MVIKSLCSRRALSGSESQLYCASMLSQFSHVQLFVTHGLLPTRILCPWDSPGKNTGVGFHALLQGICLMQTLNPHLGTSCIGRQVLYY